MPVGGKKQVNELIDKEMIYPEEAFKKKIKGTVLIHTAVNEKGIPFDTKILKSIHPELNREALRLFEKIEWIPAQSANMPTEGEKLIRVKFSIKRYKRLQAKRREIIYKHEADTSFKIYELQEVDSFPKFKKMKGASGIESYITENLIYPEMALRNSITGYVSLQYIIEESGNVTNVRIIKSLAYCNAEAVRLLSEMQFYPALKQGKRVRCKAEYTINFGFK